MRLWLVPHIFMAAVEEDIVILDVAADLYQCLLGASVWMTVNADGSILVQDEDAGAELVAAGLAVPSPPSSYRPSIIRPIRERAGGSASGLGVARAALSMSVASLRFRRQSFRTLAVPLPRSEPRGHPPAPDRLASLLSAARLAFPWLPGEGECLQRAYLLRHFLADRDFVADWVFGVRTWPFSAHCWLQTDDEVIGDRLERVRLYTPIMVV